MARCDEVELDLADLRSRPAPRRSSSRSRSRSRPRTDRRARRTSARIARWPGDRRRGPIPAAALDRPASEAERDTESAARRGRETTPIARSQSLRLAPPGPARLELAARIGRGRRRRAGRSARPDRRSLSTARAAAVTLAPLPCERSPADHARAVRHRDLGGARPSRRRRRPTISDPGKAVAEASSVRRSDRPRCAPRR